MFLIKKVGRLQGRVPAAWNGWTSVHDATGFVGGSRSSSAACRRTLATQQVKAEGNVSSRAEEQPAASAAADSDGAGPAVEDNAGSRGSGAAAGRCAHYLLL